MSIPTPYISQQPIDDFGLRFSNLLYNVTLTVSTDTTLVVPSTAQRFKVLIKIMEGARVWVALNNPAAVPAGATFASTNSELINGNLFCREVRAGDVLHFITTDPSQDVSAAFYSLGTNN